MDLPFQIAILIMSVVIHEVSHGYAASYLGDDTARWQGRLTLNPFKHLDLVGSFLVPVVAYMTAGFIFGWAKPVPYNPYYLKNQKYGPAMVGAAGPLSNILMALFFGVLIRFADAFALPAQFLQIAMFIVFLNLILAIFNLVPIPPLDGSKVLFAFLPDRARDLEIFFEKYGLILLLLFIFFFAGAILPIAAFLFRLITGLSF